jgi:phosphoglycerate kinase
MLKTLEQLKLNGKRVLCRVDFNVPIGKPETSKGEIKDDFRIRSALPTIRYVLDQGADIVLMTHIDPWDEISPATKDPRLRTNNVAIRLSELIGMPVAKVDDCVDIELPKSRIVMLENLRFHKEEKKNDDDFARKLAKNGDVYVNDAFGTCHRAHASVDAVVKYFREHGAGLLVQKEVEALQPVLVDPKHPFYVIMGGSKVGSKIAVIESLGKKADKIFIGGKMALAFAGVDYIEAQERETAARLMKQYPGKIVLPVDYRAEDCEVYSSDSIPSGLNIYDIGPETVKDWGEQIKNAKTTFSNIIVGYFEKQPFDQGTNGLIQAVARSKGFSVIGGGDSVKAIFDLIKKGVVKAEDFDHISTGGGASLEFLEGKVLPGLAALGYKI